MMRGELIQTYAEDGVRLDGFALDREPGAARRGAVLLVHGFGSNFYASSLLRSIAIQLSRDGWSVLLANTRGHDGLCYLYTAAGPLLGGAALELVGDARLDMHAWVAVLKQREPARPIFGIGHSLGAIKLLLAMTSTDAPSLAIDGCVAISPPRLHHETFASHRRAKQYERAIEEARQAEREPTSPLIRVRFPFPMLVSPATYLDKYGPASRYDWLRYLPSVRVPHAVVFGQVEVTGDNPGFSDGPELAVACERQAARSVTVIEGANHQYEQGRQELCLWIGRWLRSVHPNP
jgi:pimeloyl-ACP methyl ester carboxylesterase